MAELPEDTQTKVNEVVAERGEDGLQKLRTSIDATPEIKSALEAKGLTSAHVIAASMGSGRSAHADHQEIRLTICDGGYFRGQSAKPGPTCR